MSAEQAMFRATPIELQSATAEKRCYLFQAEAFREKRMKRRAGRFRNMDKKERPLRLRWGEDGWLTQTVDLHDMTHNIAPCGFRSEVNAVASKLFVIVR